MGSQKSLSRSTSVRTSGRQHPCRSNKKHGLPKGALMLVIKEGQDERHYCIECSSKFIASARLKLSELETLLSAA